MNRAIHLALACVVLVAAAGQLQADLVTLTPASFGRYQSDGTFSTGNYSAGQSVSGATIGGAFRGFGVFDLSSISDPITSATLRIFSRGYLSDDPFEQFTLFDVSTSISTLVSGSGGVGAYGDLGSGLTFGASTTSNADIGTFINVVLTSSAISELNASSGQFGIGLAATSLSPPAGGNSQIVFTGFVPTGGATFQLQLETQAIPEASLLPLWGIGACVIAIVAARRACGH